VQGIEEGWGTALERVPKTDVERVWLLVDKLYTASMVSTEAISR
jgi:hypothetical protein